MSKKSPLFRLTLAGCSAAVGFFSAGAAAQNAPATEDADSMEEVVVSGFRSSLEKSLEVKRASINFTDSISSEDVGKLPDNNLAEAIARIPGVQISRTNGEGQQINLRGLGPSFTRVTLDGMPISVSSEGSVDQAARNREFDFDLLPSDLFSALEVSKSPQASIVEGGLAGTVNLRPSRPFDYDGLTVSYKLEGTYQSSSEEVDPRASFLISKNWDDKFGLLLNVAATKRTFRTDGWSAQGWTSGRVGALVGTTTQVSSAPSAGYSAGFDWNLPTLAPNNATTRDPNFVNESGLTNAQLANAQVPRLGRPEVQVGDRDRVGASFAAQFRATDKLDFAFDALYAKLDASFDRYTDNLLVRNTNAGTNNATGFGFITPRNFVLDEHNNVVSGQLENAKFWSENRDNDNSTTFASYTLTGNWQATDKFKLTAKVNTAKSDWDFRMNTYLFLSDPGTVNLEINGDNIPTINPVLDIADVANWQMDTVRVQPRKRRETNDTFWLEGTYGDEEMNVKFGAVRNTFERLRNQYSTSVGVTQGAALTPFGYTGPAAMNTWDITPFASVVPVNFGEFFDADPGYRRWTVADLGAFNEMLSPAELDAAANLDYQNSGTFKETSTSAYVELNKKLELGGHGLRFNTGVRWVKTEQDLTGFVQLQSTPRPPPGSNAIQQIPYLFNIREDQYGSNTTNGEYDVALPSFNMAFDITDKLISRLSLAKTMTRPNPGDMMPFVSLSTAGVVTAGNPDLQPYFSEQADLGLEWYFQEGAVLSTTLFQKNIDGFTQRSNTVRPFRDAGIPIEGLDPTLRALVEVQGYDTPLLFNQAQNIPGITKMQGAELFYQQRLDFLLNGLGVNLNYTYLDSGDRVVLGLAKKNYNAIVYYETPRFATRLSYNVRGDYVECTNNCNSTSPEAASRAEAGYLDFNSSVNFETFGQKLTLSFEVLNLTDEVEYTFAGYDNRAYVFNAPGRTFILGLRGQF
ncbi:MAG: TonB-dependent receptor [Pseudomonadota bacterium]